MGGVGLGGQGGCERRSSFCENSKKKNLRGGGGWGWVGVRGGGGGGGVGAGSGFGEGGGGVGGKPFFGVFDKVQHKQSCTVTEVDTRTEILYLKNRGIVLSL